MNKIEFFYNYLYIALTPTLNKLNIYGFIFLNYGKIHNSAGRDARGDGQNLRAQGRAEEHGWSLGQIRQVLGRWRLSGKPEDTEDFDYEAEMWTLW